MLKNTRLATILFTDQEGSHIRVYYQDKNFIKESRYDHNNGWYTTEYDTVASDAGEKTPIAATVWAEGKEIRVYYLNDADKIVERRYSVDRIRPTGYWSDGLNILATNVASRSAQTAPTQLAVARTGWRSENIRIRLFYQSANNTLRQTMYRSDRAEWEDSLIESEDSNFEAPPGGGLAATSSGGIRLFYQNSQGILKGIKESGDEWIDQELESYTLDKNTAISTVSWVNRSSPTQIRLYAINGGKLVSRKYDVKKEEWAAPQVETNQTVHKDTSIAAAGAFDLVSASEKIKVFYQPSEKVIALFNAHETKREELGIPTTLTSVAGSDHNTTGGGGQMLRHGELVQDLIEGFSRPELTLDNLRSSVANLLDSLAVPSEKVVDIRKIIDKWAGNEDGGGLRKLFVAVIPPSATDVNGMTALHRAANLGDKVAVQGLLLDSQLDLHAKDNNGRKAAWYAYYQGRTAITALLAVRSGVDPRWATQLANHHTSDELRQSFFDAVIRGQHAVVQFVLDIGGDVHWKSGGLAVAWSDYNAPALHYANFYSWKHICQLLVSNGASTGAVDGRGNLMTAATWGGSKGYV